MYRFIDRELILLCDFKIFTILHPINNQKYKL